MEKQLGRCTEGAGHRAGDASQRKLSLSGGQKFVHKLLHESSMRRRFGSGVAELRCMMCLQELVPQLSCLTIEEHPSSHFGQH